MRLSQFNADITHVVLDITPGNILNANQLQLQFFTWKGENSWILHPSRKLDYSYNKSQHKSYADFYTQVGHNNTLNIKDLQISTSYPYSNNSSISNRIYSNNQSLNILNRSTNNSLPTHLNLIMAG